MRLTAAGEALPALDLTFETTPNAAVWRSLPPSHWVAPIRALPGTETLAEFVVGNETIPALVLRRFGSGRVMYASFDEMWRWRHKKGDRHHRRFWHQLCVWMTEDPFAVHDKRVSVDAGAIIYHPGESAQIRARIRDEKGKALMQANASALLLRNGKLLATLPLVTGETAGGVFKARTSALEKGKYEVRITVKGIPEKDIKVKAQFIVEARESGELTDLTCNEALLQQMASNTKGRFFREENVDEIAGYIEPLSRGKVVEKDTLLWQSYWWFAAVVLLLTLEWILRKRAGLM